MDEKRYKIRLASEDDIKGIQRLGDLFRFIYTDEILESIKRKLIFVYERDSKVVGFILYNRKHNTVSDLIVDPKYRRQGIGKRLFEVSTAVLRINKLEIWATLYPTFSVGFWKKMGFQELPMVRITKKGNKLKKMIWRK